MFDLSAPGLDLRAQVAEAADDPVRRTGAHRRWQPASRAAECPKETALKLKSTTGAIIAAASAIGIAVPAAAHPGNPNRPEATGRSSQSHGAAHAQAGLSHRCRAHNVAYVETGTIDAASASTLASNPDGTWSGTLVVDVTKGNHHARADTGQTVTYTVNNARLRVRFGGGASGFSAGERIKLIGKLAVVAKKCTATGPAASPVLEMGVVRPARPANA
jgi:hypothetical protein